MEKLIITGPCSLNGKITVSGSKNAALPIIAATILAPGKYKLSNVPMITDIEHLLSILADMGATFTFENNICEIDTTDINSFEPTAKKVKNIRASILLLGPLLSRFGEVKIALPGGCFIGARPMNTTLSGFEALGATIHENDMYHLSTKGLVGNKIILNEPSVTGTENLVMASVLATGTTDIRLAAAEPHVVDLCNFLVSMGAKISGVGTPRLIIEGVKTLKPTDHTMIFDQIEAGTFAIATAASRGTVTIHGFEIDHQDILLNRMREANVHFEIIDNQTIKILPTTHFKSLKIRTGFYPNFPTDLQAPFGVLMTQAEGTSEIYETIFEGRLNYLNELNKMGADCVIKNAHEATVTGPTPLFGTTITSFDLRAGATLIIAAFIARGESIIENAELIDRGYEKIDERLNALGAKIQRISS